MFGNFEGKQQQEIIRTNNIYIFLKMSRKSNDVSLIFKESPDSRCNGLTNKFQADEMVPEIDAKKVPDLSVCSDVASENRPVFIPKTNNMLCPSNLEQELSPYTSNMCIMPSVTSKKHNDNEVQCHCLKNQIYYCSSKCELSSNGLPLQCQGHFDMVSSSQKCSKFSKQVTDEISHVNLLEKTDYSSFSDDILKHFRQQDQKLDDLQNQISLFLQHKNSACLGQNLLEDKKEIVSDHKTFDSACSKNISIQKSPKVEGLDQTFILMYIKEHSDQIHKLQNQIDLLLKRTEKLEYLYSMKEENTCGNERISCSSNDGGQISPNEEASSNLRDQNFVPDQNETVFHSEKQVKKTSTSTMTSLTFEGNDKLVFRKMLTVVTDVSNHQKDVSVQYPQEIDTAAAETKTTAARINTDSPKSERQITTESTDPKKRKGKHLKSPKKSLNKNRKSNQGQKSPAILSPTNAYSSAITPQFRTNNPDCACQYIDSDRENKQADEILSPKDKILFEVARNIDKIVATRDNDDLYSPPKKTDDFSNCVLKHQKGCKTKNSPRPILSSSERNKKTNNPDCACQYSDSDRENKQANEILSPKEKILFEVARNIDQLLGAQNNEDIYSSPDGITFPKCVSKHQKGCNTKNTPCPILLSAERNKSCLRSSSRSSSASSSTSTDTVYASPHQENKADFHASYSARDATVSKYGMSSPNLSLGTKIYLEKFGLLGKSDTSSLKDKTERTSVRKHRDCRRHLR